MENDSNDASRPPRSPTDDLAARHGAQSPGEAAASLDPHADPADGGPRCLSDVDVGVVTRSVEKILRVADRKLCRHVWKKTKQITGDDKIAADFTEEAGMVEEELELISELTADVARQYELVGRHTPVTLLGIVLAGYGLRMVAVVNKLDALEARANKRKEPNNEKGAVGGGTAGSENQPVPFPSA